MVARNASPLLSIEEIVDIGIQITNGLQAAHEKGITHRDIKSTNIMLTENGDVKIMDFGLAKIRGGPELTQEQSTLGTAAYMSPERFSGEAVDQRSDIWSFGVLLFNMLTGQMPFKGDYEQAIAYSILNEEPQPVTALRSGIPMDLERIVNKCLQKEPSSRYQHADELAVDLSAIKKQIEAGKTEKRLVGSTSPKRSSVLRYGSVALLLALVVLLGMYFWPEESKESGTIDSIAVLPLENLAGDPKQDFFVDGMTEVLITELSKIEALSVVSRTAVMRFKKTDQSLPEIAEELKVDALVVGSALHVEDQVRITARLIKAGSDRHMWTNDYERNFRDVLSLQKDLARAIAGTVKIQLTPEDEDRLGIVQQVDPEAYELYLRARAIENRREGHQGALKYLIQSVEIDPNFAPAHAAMVVQYMFLSGNSMSVDEAELKARRAASKALELDDQLTEAHVAMGIVRQYFEFNWIGAEQSFKRAIQLNPKSLEAHLEYGWFLMRLERFDEARDELQALDGSLHVMVDHGLYWLNLFDGQYDLLLSDQQEKLKQDPTDARPYLDLALMYTLSRQYEQALASTEKFMSIVNPKSVLVLGLSGWVYAVAGKRKEALRLLDDIKKLPTNNDSAVNIATIYIGLGEKEAALTWLEHAYERRDVHLLSFLKVSDIYDPLRDEPRFKALLKKMNFEVDE